MNIVVVEDEFNTREGLIQIINKYTNHNVIGFAENGAKGVSVIEHLRPDIVLTDIRTPQMSGLEMLEELNKRGVEFTPIVLSGFSDFEYARQAIKLGVCEYLLKPVTVDDLNECLTQIEEKINNTDGKSKTAEELISLFLSNQPESNDDFIKKLHIKLNASEKTEFSAILFTSSPERQVNSQLFGMIKDGLQSLCYENSYVVQLSFGRGILILTSGSESNILLEKSIEANILKHVQLLVPTSASSTRFYNLINLKDIISELDSLMQYSLVIPYDKIINKQEISFLDLEIVDYPVNLESLMRNAIYNNRSTNIMDIAKQFKEFLFSKPYNPKSIIECFLTFIASTYAAFKESSFNIEESYIYQDLIKVVAETYSKQIIISTFDEFINWVIKDNEAVFQTENQLITRVIQYIREHFKEDISQTQMAELVNVTPEYLSKLFSKEMDINFSTFLRNFRISHAKRMILLGEYRMHEIAQLTGFSDQKYFNRVFKEVCGESPSSFKQRYL